MVIVHTAPNGEDAARVDTLGDVSSWTMTASILSPGCSVPVVPDERGSPPSSAGHSVYPVSSTLTKRGHSPASADGRAAHARRARRANASARRVESVANGAHVYQCAMGIVALAEPALVGGAHPSQLLRHHHRHHRLVSPSRKTATTSAVTGSSVRRAAVPSATVS